MLWVLSWLLLKKASVPAAAFMSPGMMSPLAGGALFSPLGNAMFSPSATSPGPLRLCCWCRALPYVSCLSVMPESLAFVRRLLAYIAKLQPNFAG